MLIGKRHIIDNRGKNIWIVYWRYLAGKYEKFFYDEGNANLFYKVLGRRYKNGKTKT